jgi:hypothetical protein
VDVIFACGICGGDAATDTMLVQAAIAGVMSVPFLLRDRITAKVRGWRGLPPDEEAESCEISIDEDD